MVLGAILVLIAGMALPVSAAAGGNPAKGMHLVEDVSASHPNTQVYRDPGTGEYLAVISQGPRYMAQGKSLNFGPRGGDKYSVETGYYTLEYDIPTGRTAVKEDATGSWSIWTPHIYLNNDTELAMVGNPRILPTDPINSGYHNNVIQANYGDTVYRRLRVIEGYVQEYYVIEADPNGSILIAPDVERKDIPSRDYWIQSADEGVYDGFSFNKDSSTKFITADYFKAASYPISVDDSYNNISRGDDGYAEYVGGKNGGYPAAHDAASATTVSSASTQLLVAQTIAATNKIYTIRRTGLFFNTSSIPTTAIITAANLSINVTTVANSNNDAVNITTDAATYPHIPMVVDDYHYLNYSAVDGGQISIGAITAGRNNITFRAAGLTFINKTGTGAITKLFLRTRNDVASISPGSGNKDLADSVTFSANEAGTNIAPVLYVYYTIPSLSIALNQSSIYLPLNTSASPATNTSLGITVSSNVPNFYVTVRDSSSRATDIGFMGNWTPSAYVASPNDTNLTKALSITGNNNGSVTGQTINLLTATGQNLFNGGGIETNRLLTTLLSQAVTFNDDPLPANYEYRINLEFVITST